MLYCVALHVLLLHLPMAGGVKADADGTLRPPLPLLDPSVCANSKSMLRTNIGGSGCSGLVTWPEANKFCTDQGARLCTQPELADDDSHGSGTAITSPKLRPLCPGKRLIRGGI